MRIQTTLARRQGRLHDGAGGILAMIGLGRHRAGGAVAELGLAGTGVTGLHAAKVAAGRRQSCRTSPRSNCWNHPVVALALLLSAGPGLAQGADPLKSPACGEALAGLQSARDGKAANASIETLRSRAATACLGQPGPPQRPGRVAQAPVVVPPPQIEIAPLPGPLPGPALPLPPVAIQRPPSPALCDAGGCWADDGTHLRQVPPSLAGPRGMCTQQGGQLLCP
jgi:hypothetical protein